MTTPPFRSARACAASYACTRVARAAGGVEDLAERELPVELHHRRIGRLEERKGFAGDGLGVAEGAPPGE